MSWKLYKCIELKAEEQFFNHEASIDIEMFHVLLQAHQLRKCRKDRMLLY